MSTGGSRTRPVDSRPRAAPAAGDKGENVRLSIRRGGSILMVALLAMLMVGIAGPARAQDEEPDATCS
jgi:hypothetical protein